MGFLRRLIVSLITGIVFTLSVSFIFSSGNSHYDFTFYMIFVSAYAAPSILFIGLPLSILIDHWIAKMGIQNPFLLFLTNLIFYCAAGFAGAWILLYFLAAGDITKLYFSESLYISLFGVMAAVLFFIIKKMLEFTLDKNTG